MLLSIGFWVNIHSQLNGAGLHTEAVNYDILKSDYMLELMQRFLDGVTLDADFLASVDGTPYVKMDFVNSSVYFKKNDTVAKEYMLRYNNFLDEIEFKQDNKILFIKNKSHVDRIIMNGKTYKCLYYTEKKQVREGYLEQLVDGNIKLYSRQSVSFEPEKPPTAGYEDPKPAKFTIEADKYFIQFYNKEIKDAPLTKKKINGLFKENGIDISDYLKDNKLKGNKDGLVQLVKYVNK